MDGLIGNASLAKVHQLFGASIRARRPILATYHGRERKLCPHILGRNRQGYLQVLCYQYGGESQSGLRQEDRSANWRCIALEGVTDVRLLNEPWQTAEIHTQRQTCVE